MTGWPSLTSEYADSATRLLAMQSTFAAQATAMRWFRLGVSESNHEQQFNYFWFALEIVAQALKTTEKRNSQCPRCHGRLYCEACKTHPTHRPYPGEAIRDLVGRVDPAHGSDVFETLQKVRHTLLHGNRIESIVAELPCNPQQAVDTLARVTWWAIWLMFDKPDPAKDRDLALGYSDTVVRASLIASIHMETTLLPGADIDHPRLEDFPTPTLTMESLEPEGEKPPHPQR